jgi:hypothetical protein
VEALTGPRFHSAAFAAVPQLFVLVDGAGHDRERLQRYATECFGEMLTPRDDELMCRIWYYPSAATA